MLQKKQGRNPLRQGFFWVCCVIWATLAWEPMANAQPKIADGFEIRLVASVPAIESPCQVATSPDGGLFIAENPMDQAGPANKEIDRILLFRDGKEPIVFADKLAAVFGMAWRDGALYVMHMPYLSVFRDTNGDGKADERKDLFKDLGVPPGHPNMMNDHIVSGIQFGMDGWLYIASGDKGVPKATGPDGRSVQLVGGGVMRCRPDGTRIEVLTSGTRNHLEPNLDALDRVFTYDNTDDGDGWWTRVTFHIDGGYYGYPYDYHKYQYRMINRITEYGGGSPCGGLVYKEDAWPKEYQGRVLWSEWGKRKVSAFAFEPDGAGFKVKDEIVLAEAGNGVEFRPLDLALSADGVTLYIADWAMGGWGNKNEKLGRVYALKPKTVANGPARGKDSDSIAKQIEQLAHPAYSERDRAQNALVKQGNSALKPVLDALKNPQTPTIVTRHLIWTVSEIADRSSLNLETLGWDVLFQSPSAEIRSQAVRALGLSKTKASIKPVLPLLNDSNPEVRLQAITTLGRLGDATATAKVAPLLSDGDPILAYAARIAVKRLGDWKTVGSGLASNDSRLRQKTMEALELAYDLDAARALSGFVQDDSHPIEERTRALELLAEGHRKTSPWNGRWWGTRPTQGKPFAKDVDWAGTKLIGDALRRNLTSGNEDLRYAAVVALKKTNNPDLVPDLRQRLRNEKTEKVQAEIARTLGDINDQESSKPLAEMLGDPKIAKSVRDAALASISKLNAREAMGALVRLLDRKETPAEILPELIGTVGNLKAESAVPSLVRKLDDPVAKVRTAAATALGQIGLTKAENSKSIVNRVIKQVEDQDLEARKAAIQTLGQFGDKAALVTLRKAADQESTRFEASLALTKIPDASALGIYLQGLTDKSGDLRNASSLAISSIRDQVAPALDLLAQRKELPPSVIPELRRVFSRPQPIINWQVLGPFTSNIKPPFDMAKAIDLKAEFPGKRRRPNQWRTVKPVDNLGQLNLERVYGGDEQDAFGYAELVSEKKRKAEMIVGSDDTLTVWLNGKEVYRHDQRRGFSHEQDRVSIELENGVNRIVFQCGNQGGPWACSVQISGEDAYAFLKAPASGAFNPDAYREFALKNAGNANKGQALFMDLKGLACVKCHVVAGQGGKVGPDLSDVAVKYPREELIRSVLQPSNRISSGYEAAVFAMDDGRVLTGIIKNDANDAVEIEDAEAKRIRLSKDQIEGRKTSEVSLMPNGLAEGLSPQDFADLMAYLETLKKTK